MHNLLYSKFLIHVGPYIVKLVWVFGWIHLSGWERVSLHHRILLYNIIVALGLRPAGSLLKLFMSINGNIHAQFTNFSRHPGALRPLKNEAWTKLTIEMWSQIFYRETEFGL